MIDQEIIVLKSNIDRLFNQAQSRILELRKGLNFSMVKPVLISKADASKGLRVYESEGHVCFAFPFTIKIAGILINNKSELWLLKNPIVKQLWCELTTTIMFRNGQNFFTPNFIRCYKDESLSTRFLHFHSTSGGDCSGTYPVPSIITLDQIWQIREGLANAWRSISFPCPTPIPNTDPDLKRLGEELFSGASISLAQLRQRLQKVASPVPLCWIA